MAQNRHIWQNSSTAVSFREVAPSSRAWPTAKAPGASELPSSSAGLSQPLCTRGRTAQPELQEHFSPRAWSATWFPASLAAHLWPLIQVDDTEMMRLFSWFVWAAIVLTRTIRLQNTALFYRVHILFIAINNNLILTAQRFHTILYTTGQLKFSCRWAAFGNKPKNARSAGWPLPDPLSRCFASAMSKQGKGRH